MPHGPGRLAPAFAPAAVLVVSALLTAACGGSGGARPAATTTSPTPGTRAGAGGTLRVLVFSKTAGFRHASIPAGIAAIQELGRGNGFAVDATEDATRISDAGLAPYRVLVFLSTTGDFLDSAQQAALQRWVERGGGWVGIHAAADAEYHWAFYGELVGAWFARHPKVQRATIHVTDRRHPATAALPETWTRTDEWYDFKTNPRGAVHVLATVAESSYQGGSMGADHPIIWCHPVGAGRSFYTALGHTTESFAEPLYLAQLLGAIRWAGGQAAGDCGSG
ncbi:MAG TPA: ThuA domain-containing protein [Actinomycetota bacterium]